MAKKEKQKCHYVIKKISKLLKEISKKHNFLFKLYDSVDY